MRSHSHILRRLTIQGALAVGVCAIAHSASAQSTEVPDQPVIRLLGYHGSLCPDGSLDFDSRTGALTVGLSSDINTDGTDSQSGNCHVDLRIDVADGWKFSQPNFCAHTFASSLSESTSNLRLSYTLAGDSDSFEYPISAGPEGVSDIKCDRPNISSPVCGDSYLLGIDIDADVPPDSYLSVSILDGDFTQDIGGTTWEACEG